MLADGPLELAMQPLHRLSMPHGVALVGRPPMHLLEDLGLAQPKMSADGLGERVRRSLELRVGWG